MGRRAARLLALAIALGVLGACAQQPLLPTEYAVPAPPPLQPYMGPSVSYAAAPYAASHKRRHKRHHVRRHRRRVRCRCVPVR